jgi:hypothetical protein
MAAAWLLRQTTFSLILLSGLSVIDAILGVVAADQRRASRWRTAFIALAIISLPAYGCGFIMSLLGSFPGNQGMALFATAQPLVSPATVSHAIDTPPAPE